MSQHLIRCAAVGVAVSVAFCAAGADTRSGTVPPGYSTALTGDVHDFDYFVGGWTTKQHRLEARGVGSSEWEDFPAVECLTLYLGGQATVDELYMPTKNRAGASRAFRTAPDSLDQSRIASGQTDEKNRVRLLQLPNAANRVVLRIR